jgi:hypothetical protein
MIKIFEIGPISVTQIVAIQDIIVVVGVRIPDFTFLNV